MRPRPIPGVEIRERRLRGGGIRYSYRVRFQNARGERTGRTLRLCPQRGAIVLAEIAPRFPRIETLPSALPPMAVIEEIPPAAAFLAGHAHADYRRSGGTREAVLPDFLIGAHAAVTGRPLLTRDPRRIATYIPGAKLLAP